MPSFARMTGEPPRRDSRYAPREVNRTLSAPGRPLDRETRARWEPRLGFDFSQVRIHADPAAGASARAIAARAYTVGSHVVFAPGAYAPASPAGQALLGHELAHVAQQRAAVVDPRAPLQVGHRGDAAELDASRAARAGVPPAPTQPGVVRKQEAIDVELYPTPPDEAERLRQQGINLPQVSRGTYRLSGGRLDNAGDALVPAEEMAIDRLLQGAGMPAATPGSVPGAQFLLHDTASPVGATAIARQAAQGRGPLGSGVAAYVPASGAATVTRPNFYETQRPTTTEFEKASDLITQANRETAMRAVWAATTATERTNAINRALSGLGLTAAEITAETATITGRLGGTGMIMTSGAWTVGQICSQATSAGAASVANPGAANATAITTNCGTLAPYFTARAQRVGRIVPVEIVQQAGLASTTSGSQDSCNPANPNLVPLPNPPYTNDQYANLVLLYLRAARAAGRFPETTTHFVVDAFQRGHCDPRCFDLQRFYNEIAAALGHGRGSTYGPVPNYGTTWGTNNIWWNDRICNGPHP
jgi:hypothetical protein